MKRILRSILIVAVCLSMMFTYVSAFTVEDITSEEIFSQDTIDKEAAEREELLESQRPASAFKDVATSAYYYRPVMWAVAKEITNGTSATTFSPDATCINAQIITFMWRANGCPEPGISNPFTNLNGNEYYYKAAIWAYENNMVSGSEFEANKPCTRAMTVEYFWKLAGSPVTSTIDKFTDVSSSASYAQAVAWAVENEVTNGTSDNTFTPGATCTRGQIVTFLYRAIA